MRKFNISILTTLALLLLRCGPTDNCDDAWNPTSRNCSNPGPVQTACESEWCSGNSYNCFQFVRWYFSNGNVNNITWPSAAQATGYKGVCTYPSNLISPSSDPIVEVTANEAHFYVNPGHAGVFLAEDCTLEKGSFGSALEVASNSSLTNCDTKYYKWIGTPSNPSYTNNGPDNCPGNGNTGGNCNVAAISQSACTSCSCTTGQGYFQVSSSSGWTNHQWSVSGAAIALNGGNYVYINKPAGGFVSVTLTASSCRGSETSVKSYTFPSCSSF